MKYCTTKSVLALICLSGAFLIAPLIQKSEFIGMLDVIAISIAFVLVLAVQVILIIGFRFIELKLWNLDLASGLLCCLFLLANAFYFLYVLLSAPRYVFIMSAVVLATIFVISQRHERLQHFIFVFAGVFLGICLGSAVVSLYQAPETISAGKQSQINGPTQRSVYVVVFDSLVSRSSLEMFYGSGRRPHVRYLEDEGFQLYDVLSAGDSTIESFVKMLALGQFVVSKRYKTFFNGIDPVPLYALLRQKGFKIQFVAAQSYFGIDVGKLDSYFPKYNTVSICDFVDARYMMVLCAEYLRNAIWRPSRGQREIAHELGSDVNAQTQFVLSKLAYRKNMLGDHWFSISYINYPGHSPTNYHFSDMVARTRFIAEMNTKNPQLVDQVMAIKSHILAQNRDAVIVFLGDHGGWLTRSAQPGDALQDNIVLDQNLIDLDRRGVLLAVYPRQFCAKRLRDRADTSLVLGDLAVCAAEAD